MGENEDFYDTEIAPALLALAERCKERGMSLVAMVEYDLGEVGLTEARTEKTGVQYAVASMAARALGNVDNLIMALERYGKEHGHNSVYITLLDRGGVR